jgi:hypothetical protein
MSARKLDSVLIIGGSGIVGAKAAETLRRLQPDLRVTIGGRNVERAQAVAKEVGGADATKVDLQRADLGLSDQARHSAIVVFVKDHTLNSLRYAQTYGIPYVSVSSGLYEVGPEMARFIHHPAKAPVLMASNWLAGAATFPALHFIREFESVDTIDIVAVLDEQDMGGPAAFADFERLTKSAPNPAILKDGEFRWISGAEAERDVTDVDGKVVKAQTYSPLDVLSLSAATDAKSIRFDLVYGESASRRNGRPFSTSMVIEIAGRKKDGAQVRERHELVHPAGQAPVTALCVAVAVERLLGLAGGAPVAPGLYLPEVLIDPGYMVGRMQEFGMRFGRA